MATALYNTETRKFNTAAIMRLAHERAANRLVSMKRAGLCGDNTYADYFADTLRKAWSDARFACSFAIALVKQEAENKRLETAPAIERRIADLKDSITGLEMTTRLGVDGIKRLSEFRSALREAEMEAA